MPCSCRTTVKNIPVFDKVVKADSAALVPVPVQSAPELPHSVLPGESCIFCAEKHTSLAYAAYSQQMQLGAILGELELARRHTLYEFRDISSMISKLEEAVVLRDIKYVNDMFPTVLQVLADMAEASMEEQAKLDANIETEDDDQGQDRHEEPTTMVTIPQQAVVMNPFLGEIHFCAAWRLAFEIGYMMPNKAMIIGDLALAREHLVRFNYEANNALREFRHRVQTRRAADLDISWPEFASSIRYLIDSRMDEFKEKYSFSLENYLMPKTPEPPAAAAPEDQSGPQEQQDTGM